MRGATPGCLYGEGYVKIFAGESAEDESALLAFEEAEFESYLSIVSCLRLGEEFKLIHDDHT